MGESVGSCKQSSRMTSLQQISSQEEGRERELTQLSISTTMQNLQQGRVQIEHGTFLLACTVGAGTSQGAGVFPDSLSRMSSCVRLRPVAAGYIHGTFQRTLVCSARTSFCEALVRCVSTDSRVSGHGQLLRDANFSLHSGFESSN